MAARKTAKKAVQQELGADAIRANRQAVKNIEQKVLEVTAKRGVIESDDDWFENWKGEDHDVIKAEGEYLKAYGVLIEARRKLEQAKNKMQQAYREAGIDPYIVV